MSKSWKSAARVAALAVVAALVAACGSRPVAPVEERTAVAPRAQPPAATPAPAPAAPAARPPEPDTRPSTYMVKRGDTLHQIALDNGLDYRELAAWNGIDNVNLIRVGQVLRLSAPTDGPAQGEGPAAVTTAPLRGAPSVSDAKPPLPPPAPSPSAQARNTDTYKSGPKAIKEPYSAQAARELARADAAPSRADTGPAPAATASPPEPTAATPAAPSKSEPAPASPPQASGGDDESLDWMWPVKGKVIAGFSESSSLKGLDIGGSAGQPVLASAAGKVVYAGSGLRGYGKLVIIKHNRTYLSAYAHNREILVKEGQQVTRGQKIAEMGNTDTDTVKLHFEIRRHGRPMDPVKYLPPA